MKANRWFGSCVSCLVLAGLVGSASASGWVPDATFIVGTWSADLSELMNVADLPPEERAAMEVAFANASMVLVFDEDGTYRVEASVMGEQEVETGTWVAALAGAGLSVTTTAADGTVETLSLDVIDMDTARLSDETQGVLITRIAPGSLAEPTSQPNVQPAAALATRPAPQDAWPEPQGVSASEEWFVGTWNARVDVMLATQEMSQAEYDMAIAMLGDSTIQLTVEPGGRMSFAIDMMGQSQRETGTYVVLSVAGDTLQLRTTTAPGEGEESDVETMEAVFHDRDHMTLGDVSERLPFQRAE